MNLQKNMDLNGDKMKLGIIGLGKMGNAIAYRVLKSGHEVIGFDTEKKALLDVKKLVSKLYLMYLKWQNILK